MNSEILNVINLISDKKRAEALDKIDDILYAKASEVLDTYKQSVASTYFDEPVEDDFSPTQDQ